MYLNCDPLNEKHTQLAYKNTELHDKTSEQHFYGYTFRHQEIQTYGIIMFLCVHVRRNKLTEFNQTWHKRKNYERKLILLDTEYMIFSE
jgi:hypothetical protein